MMKKITTVIISVLIVMSVNCVVFAGMADWDDKSADEAANKQLQEQKNELTGMETKSTDNYLESLNVEVNGDTLKLDFDKQTVNYDIGKIKENKLDIIAKAEDEKATINGTGTVTLNEGENDLRVDVIAESGTTRTYHIKVTYVSDEEEPTKEENNIQNSEVKETNVEIKLDAENTQTSNEKNSNIKAIIGIIIVALFAIIVIRAIKNK